MPSNQNRPTGFKTVPTQPAFICNTLQTRKMSIFLYGFIFEKLIFSCWLLGNCNNCWLLASVCNIELWSCSPTNSDLFLRSSWEELLSQTPINGRETSLFKIPLSPFFYDWLCYFPPLLIWILTSFSRFSADGIDWISPWKKGGSLSYFAKFVLTSQVLEGLWMCLSHPSSSSLTLPVVLPLLMG